MNKEIIDKETSLNENKNTMFKETIFVRERMRWIIEKNYSVLAARE